MDVRKERWCDEFLLKMNLAGWDENERQYVSKRLKACAIVYTGYAWQLYKQSCLAWLVKATPDAFSAGPDSDEVWLVSFPKRPA